MNIQKEKLSVEVLYAVLQAHQNTIVDPQGK